MLRNTEAKRGFCGPKLGTTTKIRSKARLSILKFIKDNPGKMQHQIAHGLGYSHGHKISSALYTMKAAGLIDQKGGYYIA